MLEKRILILAFVLLLGSAGCSYFQPDTAPAAYIQIDSIPFRDSIPQYAAETGRNAVDIHDAWVFLNGEPVGCFELPARIPIKYTDGQEVRITVEPGVISDGVSGYRVSYPFYTTLNTRTKLKQDGVTKISFTSTYKTANGNLRVPMPLYYTFENANDNTQLSVVSSVGTTKRITDPSLIFKDGGTACMMIQGPDTGRGGIMEYESRNIFRLPQDNSPIYLELNYRSTVNFQLGLSAQGSFGQAKLYDLTLLPTNGEWRKVYVSLVDEMVAGLQSVGSSRSNTYRILVRALSTGKPNEYVLLDNMRLLHMDRL